MLWMTTVDCLGSFGVRCITSVFHNWISYYSVRYLHWTFCNLICNKYELDNAMLVWLNHRLCLINKVHRINSYSIATSREVANIVLQFMTRLNRLKWMVLSVTNKARSSFIHFIVNECNQVWHSLKYSNGLSSNLKKFNDLRSNIIWIIETRLLCRRWHFDRFVALDFLSRFMFCIYYSITKWIAHMNITSFLSCQSKVLHSRVSNVI